MNGRRSAGLLPLEREVCRRVPAFASRRPVAAAGAAVNSIIASVVIAVATAVVAGVLTLGALRAAALAADAPASDPQAGERADPLPGMEPLELDEPLDVAMVAGIDRWLSRRLDAAPAARAAAWPPAVGGTPARRRARLREIIGVGDRRAAPPAGAASVDVPVEAKVEAKVEAAAGIDSYGPVTDGGTGAGVAAGGGGGAVTITRARYEVLEGVTADGLWLAPRQPPRAVVIALGDADWTPEAFAGLAPGVPPQARLPWRLAERGAAVFVPTLVDRDCRLSGDAAVRFTNQPHREFLQRMAFQLGRHPVGYEVEKVLAGVDRLRAADWRGADGRPLPLGVCGVGEGAIVALCAAACDERIAAALVCGAFGPREEVWAEPIYRNVWSQLVAHGDAELAALVAPRRLVIEACAAPEVAGPPAPTPDRRGAAPGRIVTPSVEHVRAEAARARQAAAAIHGEQGRGAADAILLVESAGGRGPAGSGPAIDAFATSLGLSAPSSAGASARADRAAAPGAAPDADVSWAAGFDATVAAARQARQFTELVRFTQRLLDTSDRVRAAVWREFDMSAPAAAERSAARFRDLVHDSFIGRLPSPSVPARPRSRRILDDEAFTGHELAIDVHPDVIAGGILLVPKGIPPGERRAVVVCQHGLEGRPIDTITGEGTEGFAAYKAFAARLARRGYVVYTPQNPYRGQDRFRVLQRKANPLGLSLFSVIVAQHERSLDVLAALPFVDPARIGFYGLSYGGKTAMRVPALVPRYALSICSGDFNDWIRKVVTTGHGTSYMFHGEYEMTEWNMGHVANYAELAWLIAPRPFMVERGHRDGCAPDEWVAAEYAKARLAYVRMGIPERTEIEWFDGPHTINGDGTFRFLDRFLGGPRGGGAAP